MGWREFPIRGGVPTCPVCGETFAEEDVRARLHAMRVHQCADAEGGKPT